MADTWQQYQRKQLIRSGKDISDLPRDVTISTSKKILLSNDILQLIWKVKKLKKGVKSDRQIIKNALIFYLHRLKKGSN